MCLGFSVEASVSVLALSYPLASIVPAPQSLKSTLTPSPPYLFSSPTPRSRKLPLPLLLLRFILSSPYTNTLNPKNSQIPLSPSSFPLFPIYPRLPLHLNFLTRKLTNYPPPAVVTSLATQTCSGFCLSTSGLASLSLNYCTSPCFVLPSSSTGLCQLPTWSVLHTTTIQSSK